ARPLARLQLRDRDPLLAGGRAHERRVEAVAVGAGHVSAVGGGTASSGRTRGRTLGGPGRRSRRRRNPRLGAFLLADRRLGRTVAAPSGGRSLILPRGGLALRGRSRRRRSRGTLARLLGAGLRSGLGLQDGDDLTEGNDVAFVRLQLDDRPRDRRRDLRVDLVGRDLEHVLILLAAVSHLLQPLENGAFRDTLPHLGHDHVDLHRYTP